ncbi:MAG: aromatic amino acid hydroxylase [Bacteroidales bacterium]|nr:aromatic amino acid hydroxylase [Bacteroidales bacterium]MCF8403815.1 aromatic amino acid hydroxylase [Bacteroidales bacterium]
MEMNDVLDKLPRHLLKLVIDQPYNSYTAQDHAVWRYVMRQNVRYLPKVAHHSYLDGLKQTGISIDRIPQMYGMNRILKKIGWAAVAVDGFIPPAAFMEFQAYNVLVIAADIRPIDQIEYTPAPDIIHEAAGHAPIIADPEYAEYLKLFGEIGARAFSSAHNYKIYEAVRHLSILKANPYSSLDDIKLAEFELAELEKDADLNSEMARIRNLHWWTVEYGLVGDLDHAKLYGAGLLSSIGESFSSLQPDVKKIPYSVEAANQGFDITTRQPQLFVTPDFDYLIDVLDLFACGLAIRRGGLYGVKKAIESENTATIEYSSGLQVTGTFTEVLEDGGAPLYIRTLGPTALSYKNKQLRGHGKDFHQHGFGSPVGHLKKNEKPLYLYTASELKAIGIQKDTHAQIDFVSGVEVKGKVIDMTWLDGRLIIISFSDCSVRYKGRLLFESSWGVYDMAIGEKINSAYSGAADPDAFEFIFEPPKEKTHKIIHTDSAKKLHGFYNEVREIRENNVKDTERLAQIFEILKSEYPNEWLLQLEVLEEIIKYSENGIQKEVISNLLKIKDNFNGLKDLINNGLEMLHLQDNYK